MSVSFYETQVQKKLSGPQGDTWRRFLDADGKPFKAIFISPPEKRVYAMNRSSAVSPDVCLQKLCKHCGDVFKREDMRSQREFDAKVFCAPSCKLLYYAARKNI